ncbi:hypothetical protein SUGI_0051950 [Cryptomeria japonica]|nr:hypothetical protein SUGI_0051950 [Cryptomeria japonica]
MPITDQNAKPRQFFNAAISLWRNQFYRSLCWFVENQNALSNCSINSKRALEKIYTLCGERRLKEAIAMLHCTECANYQSPGRTPSI